MGQLRRLGERHSLEELRQTHAINPEPAGHAMDTWQNVHSAHRALSTRNTQVFAQHTLHKIGALALGACQIVRVSNWL